MPRLVALDVGDATVGVAASDDLGIAAHPVRTIRRSASIKADLREVEDLLAELEASRVIVGLPVDQEGNEGPQAAKVREFGKRLERRLRIPVEYWDERFSTREAEDRLLRIDKSRAKRRKVIDAAAAAIILEEYMSASGRKTSSEA